MDMEKSEMEEPKKEKFNKMKSFKVLKSFTADKHYRVNSIFESSNKELIKELLNEKYIK